MSGTVAIQVTHNFETAHRLPFLVGKCQSLHGHSWKVLITFTAYQHQTGMNQSGISLEYGVLKKLVRGWIDEHLDHGTMIGVKDELLPALVEDRHTKLFVFGDLGWLDIAAEEEGLSSYKPVVQSRGAERNYSELPWPTVEATARMLAERLQEAIDLTFKDTLWIEAVSLAETATNSAVWIPNGADDDRFARFDERLYATPTQATMASAFADSEIMRAGE